MVSVNSTNSFPGYVNQGFQVGSNAGQINNHFYGQSGSSNLLYSRYDLYRVDADSVFVSSRSTTAASNPILYRSFPAGS